MDLERMLDKCRRGQWSVDQLDWSVPPRPMAPGEEMIIVQYFTDMAGIERLAKSLFEEQLRRAESQVLAEIFTTFIVDEERHAQAAERLAAHYDVHRYKRYQLHPTLLKFRPVFVDAIRHISAEFANVYITSGELLLDVALLRGLSDYVDDHTCRQAMRLINRDESRHIAMDYYMVGYYASAEYQERARAHPPRSALEWARASAAFARVLYHAAPFVREIFIQPLAMVDPSNRHMREAFKRIQLLGRKPEVGRRPFARFLRALQLGYDTPVVGAVFGKVLTRIAGVPGDALTRHYDAEEAGRAARMSYDDLAREALALKYTRPMA
jgi:hypothetical protein